MAFGIWVHGDAQGGTQSIRLRDVMGQVHQVRGEQVSWGHWGGANDGLVHVPIKWDTLFLLDSHWQAMEGEIFLSAPTLIY